MNRNESDLIVPAYLQRIGAILEEEEQVQKMPEGAPHAEAVGVLYGVTDVAGIVQNRFSARLPLILEAPVEFDTRHTESGHLAADIVLADTNGVFVVLDNMRDVAGYANIDPEGAEDELVLIAYEGVHYGATMADANPYKNTFVERYKGLLPRGDQPHEGIRFAGVIRYPRPDEPEVRFGLGMKGMTFEHKTLFVPPTIADKADYSRQQMQFARNYLLGSGEHRPLIEDILQKGRMVR